MEELEELPVGASVFWRAVAQEKPALRKEIMAQLINFEGDYSVRYGSGGVTIRRLA